MFRHGKRGIALLCALFCALLCLSGPGAALAALSDRPLSGDKLGHCSVSEAVDSDEHRGENSHAE